MHTIPDNDERLKLGEAVAATAIVAFAAGAIALTFAILVARCFAMETIDHLSPKRK